MTRLLLILFFLGNVANISAQKAFDNESRASYIFYIAKNVTWSNEEKFDDFKLGILAHDSSLYNALKNKSLKESSLKNKPLKIILFNKIETITPTQVLYVHQKSGFNIFEVSDKTWGNNTLIISENYPYHKSMLNFIVVDGKRKFEINQRKFKAAGLSADPLFLVHAIKNEADWQAIYEKTEKALQQEKQVVAIQKDKIQEQKAQINNQEKQIEEQILLINKQTEKLNQLKHDIIQQKQILQSQKKVLYQQKEAITQQKKELAKQNKAIREQKDILAKQKKDIAKQQNKLSHQEKMINQQIAALEKQKIVIYFFIILALILLLLGYYIFRAYRIKRKSNIKLAAKNDEITKQRDTIVDQNKKIIDSINYAQRIQNAVLPDMESLANVLDNFFILYKPRDIVSGDFYWQTTSDGHIIIVAADCTGHGVPGAFMSMLGITFLNDIVNRQKITSPGEILNQLRKNIIMSLHQDEESKGSKIRDGMDIAICSLNLKEKRIQYAGANNPLILIRNNEINVFKADKMPVAIHEKMISFTNHKTELKKGDTIYIFSDGFADQFGGEKGRKFMMKRLKQTLLDIHQLTPMKKQKEELDNIFEEWKGDEEQLDDVVLIGIKI